MEAFSLLKFWRLNPTDAPSPAVDLDADAPIQLVESDSESSSSDDSFFDLEFTLPGQDSRDDSPKNDDVDSASDFLESPNDGFCKSDPNSKPQSPISFLRSPPKFSVLMFFKKPKLDKTETATTPDASPLTPSRFAVKCDVEEFPIWSLLNRVNSSRTKFEKKASEEDSSKRVGKGGVQRYLKLIKPLYAGDRKRCGEEVKASASADPTSSPALARSPSKQGQRKQGSKTASLRVAYKLGKSRSAAGGVAPVPGSKSDDSLVLHNDGIQGAILHCKRSYNSPGDFSSRSRFASEASDEISGSSRNSSEDDEKERSSI
ncbi:hypothetical protein RHSIM_Rhsim03G0195500 [Rhododendron simsii]|nr:hypothetical protein RHSIM_Rhsim03G0195500 [Rhododendron simsii]